MEIRDDLISRAAAIENVRHKPHWFTPDGLCALAYDDIEAAIMDVPAVGAVPMVHARWVDEEGNPVPWCDALPSSPAFSCWCSQCGTWLVASDEYPVYGLFCPACGAKMDGERRDDNA